MVCNGRRKDVLLRVAAGEPVGTLFLAADRLASRKHWLAFTTRTRGALVRRRRRRARAASSAARACCRPASPAIRGEFGIGDPVACIDARGVEIARGLVAYSSEAIERIAGLPTQRIDSVLGYSNGGEVIHRDDLVLSARPGRR